MDNNTVKYWFNKLPNDLKKRAFANLQLQCKKGADYTKELNSSATSTHAALSGSFVWSGTAEGHNYWEKVFNTYYKKESK